MNQEISALIGDIIKHLFNLIYTGNTGNTCKIWSNPNDADEWDKLKIKTNKKTKMLFIKLLEIEKMNWEHLKNRRDNYASNKLTEKKEELDKNVKEVKSFYEENRHLFEIGEDAKEYVKTYIEQLI